MPIETVPAADPCAFKRLPVDSPAYGRGIMDCATMTGDAIAAMLTATRITCRLVFIVGLIFLRLGTLTEPFSQLISIRAESMTEPFGHSVLNVCLGEEIC